MSNDIDGWMMMDGWMDELMDEWMIFTHLLSPSVPSFFRDDNLVLLLQLPPSLCLHSFQFFGIFAVAAFEQLFFAASF